MPVRGVYDAPLHESATYVWTGAIWTRISASGQGDLAISLQRRWAEILGMPDWHINRDTRTAVNTNLAAGNNTLSLTAIAGGDLVVVQQVCAVYFGTAPTDLRIALYDGSDVFYILHQTTVVSGTWYVATGLWDMKAGDQVQCIVTGATAGDDLYLRSWGRKIQE